MNNENTICIEHCNGINDFTICFTLCYLQYLIKPYLTAIKTITHKKNQMS